MAVLTIHEVKYTRVKEFGRTQMRNTRAQHTDANMQAIAQVLNLSMVPCFNTMSPTKQNYFKHVIPCYLLNTSSVMKDQRAQLTAYHLAKFSMSSSGIGQINTQYDSFVAFL